jgi:two-component system response regulator (stage 0 sporulation protein F)
MFERRMLIVDDDKFMLNAYKRLFKFAGIEVDTAKSMEKALTLIKKKAYRAMVTDLCLTDKTGKEGFELLQAMKNVNRETKLILITAYGENRIREKAEELGIDYYFEKPLRLDNLINILETLTN